MSINKRSRVATLSLSAAALVTLVMHEGYTDKAVIPVKGDVPTIGFGTTTGVKIGDTTTPPAALARALGHIQRDEIGLRRCVATPVTQAEYDTMADFSYQYGVGTLCASSIVRHTNAERYSEACDAYLAYRYMTSDRAISGWEPYKFVDGKPVRWRFDCSAPGNKVCAGVWARSLERQRRCMGAAS